MCLSHGSKLVADAVLCRSSPWGFPFRIILKQFPNFAFSHPLCVCFNFASFQHESWIFVCARPLCVWRFLCDFNIILGSLLVPALAVYSQSHFFDPVLARPFLGGLIYVSYSPPAPPPPKTNLTSAGGTTSYFEYSCYVKVN